MNEQTETIVRATTELEQTIAALRNQVGHWQQTAEIADKDKQDTIDTVSCFLSDLDNVLLMMVQNGATHKQREGQLMLVRQLLAQFHAKMTDDNKGWIPF